jgi:hypothetical protein
VSHANDDNFIIGDFIEYKIGVGRRNETSQSWLARDLTGMRMSSQEFDDRLQAPLNAARASR